MKFLILSTIFLLSLVRADNKEHHEITADTSHVLNLFVDNIYKSDDIFIRELISNAADAMNKLYTNTLINSPGTAQKLKEQLKITIKPNKEEKTITITDTGIGMSKDDLIKNLGTIARSGTREFAKKIKDLEAAKNATGKSNEELVGQFGVGFYSAFKTAHTVSVRSRLVDAPEEHIWTFSAGSNFTVEKVDSPELEHGTEITLHLKESALEFLNADALSKVILHYSGFVTFPILLWQSKEEEYEVPIEKEEKVADNSTESEANETKADEDAEVEEDTEDNEPKTRTETRTVTDWVVVNKQRPIWLRDPSSLSESNYTEFYTSLAPDDKETPFSYIHFVGSGTVEFRAVIFVPGKAPPQQQEQSAKRHNIKLFVRRVFVTDEMDDLLPSYLSFVKGVVESDDFPLNASRETLQQSKLLKMVGTKLVSKTLEMLKDLSINDPAKYALFWKEYSVQIKLGLLEDKKNAKKIEKLLRFDTSVSNSTKSSLDDYISRMKKDQKQIFYTTGDKLAAINNSVAIQGPKTRGYEVLLLAEPIDEYLMQQLGSAKYQGKKFKDIGKGDLTYGDETKEEKEKVKSETKRFAPLTDYIKDVLSESVGEVRLSNRITKAPAVIVATEHGWTGNMQRIMEAQAVGGQDGFLKDFYAKQKKDLELNAKHPLVEALLKKVGQAGEVDESNKKESANLNATLFTLWDVTLLQSGFQIRNIPKFSKRLDKILRNNLGVDENAEAEVTFQPAKEREEAEKDQDAKAKEKSEERLEAQVDGADVEEDPEDFAPPMPEESEAIEDDLHSSAERDEPEEAEEAAEDKTEETAEEHSEL